MRIKDITSVKGVRDNQLVGYGLVVGLQGTGDTLQNAPFTGQSLQAMMDRMGVNVRNANLRTRNVAAVMVTAELPPFAAHGTRIDVTVSSMGDAASLMGGTLLLTTMSGADGQVYAVAQGAVSVTGFAEQGQAETLTQGVPTAGHISNGATVEREVENSMPDGRADEPRIAQSRFRHRRADRRCDQRLFLVALPPSRGGASKVPIPSRSIARRASTRPISSPRSAN